MTYGDPGGPYHSNGTPDGMRYIPIILMWIGLLLVLLCIECWFGPTGLWE
jgi:hypothetical protein